MRVLGDKNGVLQPDNDKQKLLEREAAITD